MEDIWKIWEADEEEILQTTLLSGEQECILSVIKRMFGKPLTSRLVRMQDGESAFRVIAYNMHGMTVYMAWFLRSRSGLSIKYHLTIIICLNGQGK